jgi:hypothetical protein
MHILTLMSLCASIGMLVTILNAFPASSTPQVDGGGNAHNAALAFSKVALKWTTEAGSNPYGAPSLHLSVARRLTAHGDFKNANIHYLRARSGVEHAQMVDTW